jgi:hypothetical protein
MDPLSISVERIWAMCLEGDDDCGLEEEYQEEMRLYEQEQQLVCRDTMEQVFHEITKLRKD